MKSFPEGTKVRTNKAYQERFGRTVTGVVVYYKEAPPPPFITLIRWEQQEGNVIPEQQDQLVIMMTQDLEPFMLH